jgi:hypothetical protein
VENDPTDHTPGEYAAFGGDGHRVHHHSEGVAQVADCLVGCHATPLPCAIRGESAKTGY